MATLVDGIPLNDEADAGQISQLDVFQTASQEIIRGEVHSSGVPGPHAHHRPGAAAVELCQTELDCLCHRTGKVVDFEL